MATFTTYRRRVVNNIGWLVARYTFVIVLAVLFLIPFVWMLSTSFKQTAQAYAFPPEFIPQPITFENYRNLWGGLIPFDRFYLNTTVIVIFVEIGTLLSCTVVAFSFARL